MNDTSQSGFATPNPLGVRPAVHLSVGGVSRGGAVDRVRASFAEKLFVVVVLVLSTSAFVTLFPGELGIEHVQGGEVFAQILWSLVYLLLFFIARKRLKELICLVWEEKLYIFLLGWASLSVVWSIDRQLTIRHLIALLATSLFGVYLAVRYDLREQLRLVSIALGIVIVSSVAACLLFPKYGIEVGDRFDEVGWQGVFSGKNMLARLVVLAALILALYLLNRRWRLIIVAAVALLFKLVALTNAKTSLVFFVAAIAAFPFLRAFQIKPASRRTIIVLGILVFGSLASWTYYNWENFTYSLGKDPGLTGRVAMWSLSMTWISERPLLGYGYDAFWSDSNGPAADFRIASGWLEAPHAHNGFINLWLDLGLIGVLLFILGFVSTYRKALTLASATKAAEGIWPITFLSVLFVYSLTELGFLYRNDLFWILYVAVMFTLRINSARDAATGRQVV